MAQRKSAASLVALAAAAAAAVERRRQRSLASSCNCAPALLIERSSRRLEPIDGRILQTHAQSHTRPRCAPQANTLGRQACWSRSPSGAQLGAFAFASASASTSARRPSRGLARRGSSRVWPPIKAANSPRDAKYDQASAELNSPKTSTLIGQQSLCSPNEPSGESRARVAPISAQSWRRARVVACTNWRKARAHTLILILALNSIPFVPLKWAPLVRWNSAPFNQ